MEVSAINTNAKFQNTASITSPYTVSTLRKPIPELKKDHALIKVLTAGICGSDLSRISHGDTRKNNLTVGHECVGVIEAIDNSCQLNSYIVGEKVVVVPILPCYLCVWCKMGEYGHCENYSFLGSREDGALAEYLSIPTKNLVKINEDISNNTAVFVEPLSVAIHALFQLKNIQQTFAIVIGAGTIGLLTLQLLKLYGAAKVIVFDIIPEKLEIAKQLGADFVIDPSKHEALSSIKEIMKDYDSSVIIESSNSPNGKSLALEMSLPKGEVIFIGDLSSPWEISNEEFHKILRKEIILKGSWMNYSAPFPGKEWLLAVKLIEQKKVKVEKLITHEFPLKNTQDAVNILFDPRAFKIKILIHPGVSDEQSR